MVHSCSQIQTSLVSLVLARHHLSLLIALYQLKFESIDGDDFGVS